MRNRFSAQFHKKWPLYLLEIGMIVFAVIYFIPIYAIIVISFKPTREMIYTPLAFPTSFYLENFKEAWKMLNLGTAYFNSLLITLSAVLFRIVLASMAAFTLAKKQNRSNKFLYVLFLSGMMIPIYTVLVPLLKLIKSMGLINSRVGLIVVYIATGMPFAIFLLVGFIKGIPNELIEAGVIDGCTVYKTFWSIIFPLLKPVVTTLFILDFLGVWNDFLLPMLMLSSESMKTVTLAMYNFYGEFGTRWEMTFAAYTLAIVPLVILYLCLQKNIVQGIMVGAVKG